MSDKKSSSLFSKFAKIFTIGCFGGFFLIVISFLTVYWLFTPIYKFDEKKGQIQLFGGHLSFDANQSYSYNYNTFGGNEEENYPFKINESFSLNEWENKTISLIHNNSGEIVVGNHEENRLELQCLSQVDGLLKWKNHSLDMSNRGKLKCQVKIPKDYTINLSIINGEISINALNSYEIKATDLLLKVNGDLPFDYDIEVKNGIAPAVPFIESAIYHAKITAENLVIEIN